MLKDTAYLSQKSLDLVSSALVCIMCGNVLQDRFEIKDFIQRRISIDRNQRAAHDERVAADVRPMFSRYFTDVWRGVWKRKVCRKASKKSSTKDFLHFTSRHFTSPPFIVVHISARRTTGWYFNIASPLVLLLARTPACCCLYCKLESCPPHQKPAYRKLSSIQRRL